VNNEMAENSDIFIISTGTNIYGHPTSETLTAIDNAGKRYMRTDYYNAIKVVFGNKIIKFYAFSPKNKKYKRMQFP
ncbi:hypothetical protein II906_10655, partial [bacterium]|nr:hypothetical protein [bacterium]